MSFVFGLLVHCFFPHLIAQLQHLVKSVSALDTSYKSISICATASSVSDKTDNDTIVGRGGLLDVDVDCAETLPGTTFRVVELLSSLLNDEVAELVEGTEFLSLYTRVMSTTTDPLLNEFTMDRRKDDPWTFLPTLFISVTTFVAKVLNAVEDELERSDVNVWSRLN